LIPVQWRRYVVPNITVNEWVSDFATRLEQLQRLGSQDLGDIGTKGVWLGGLFSAEAFFTASRQHVAQSHQWSLQELCMVIDVGADIAPDDCTYVVNGLVLEGAAWGASKMLTLSDKVSSALPATHFKWVRQEERKLSGSEVSIPVYLNSVRSELLFDVLLQARNGVPVHVWDQRSVGLITWQNAV